MCAVSLKQAFHRQLHFPVCILRHQECVQPKYCVPMASEKHCLALLTSRKRVNIACFFCLLCQSLSYMYIYIYIKEKYTLPGCIYSCNFCIKIIHLDFTKKKKKGKNILNGVMFSLPAKGVFIFVKESSSLWEHNLKGDCAFLFECWLERLLPAFLGVVRYHCLEIQKEQQVLSSSSLLLMGTTELWGLQLFSILFQKGVLRPGVTRLTPVFWFVEQVC